MPWNVAEYDAATTDDQPVIRENQQSEQINRSANRGFLA
jgi:hypothetical protein|tara:strand:- start:193 stop:309 length:117 start_codon:yes stop_codon:yes gene_type:complete